MNDTPITRRMADDPERDRAAELLLAVPPPPPLSQRQRQRIRAAVHAAVLVAEQDGRDVGRRRSRSLLQRFAFAPGLLALTLFLLWLRSPASTGKRSGPAPQAGPSIAANTSPPSSHAAPEGLPQGAPSPSVAAASLEGAPVSPAGLGRTRLVPVDDSASYRVQSPGVVRLDAGGLWARTDDESLLIEVAGGSPPQRAKVSVRPRSMVEVQLGRRVEVAAYLGSAAVEMSAYSSAIELGDGEKLCADCARGVSAVSAERAVVAASALRVRGAAPGEPAASLDSTTGKQPPRSASPAIAAAQVATHRGSSIEKTGVEKTGDTPARRAATSGASAAGSSARVADTNAAGALAAVVDEPGIADADELDGLVHPAPPVAAADAEASSDPLLSESRLLAGALERLHGGHDAAGALALLDRSAREFPHGALAVEARMARVDALFALGRRPAALEVLDGMKLDGTVRSEELRVLRAELRAEAGRYPSAIADFRAALPIVRDGLEERARYGVAVCRARSGDSAGARVDLGEYLARFPDGRFAVAARRSLGLTGEHRPASDRLNDPSIAPFSEKQR